jgi:hypothetical protein
MKMKFQYIGLLAFLIAAVSCKKDNYKEPTTVLKGKIVYQGEAIQVEYDRVPFELYQFGFGKVGAIRQSFTQEGTYSCKLFNGEYKLIIPTGQGPFKWKQTTSGAPDSILIKLNGDQTFDLEVTPYYMIRTPQFSAAAGKVNGSFKAEKIVVDATGKNIESVSLYINKTQFVSATDNIAVTTITGANVTDPNNISMQVTIPAMVPTQNYVFARVGIKIAGVEDRIFSPVQKLTF